MVRRIFTPTFGERSSRLSNSERWKDRTKVGEVVVRAPNVTAGYLNRGTAASRSRYSW